MSAAQHIAHLNWAYLAAPWGDPAVAGFTDNVARVNATAARMPGFVARPDLSERQIHRLLFAPRGTFDPAREAVTLSVWESAEALEAFVYRTVHGKFVTRRAEWFLPVPGPAYVIWPIDRGHVPTLAEADAALARLECEGAGPSAFDFKWLHAQREMMG
ncbi:MAG: DUF3291 domain-containing protein [Pseudomonadota bacterium]